MFSHIMLGSNNIQESKVFYDAVLGAIGYDSGVIDEKGRCFYVTDSGIFSISEPIDGKPACHGNGSTFGFVAGSDEQVDAWHSAGLATGGAVCEDAPGIRKGAAGTVYMAYLRDPTGNKICALHRAA